MGSPDASSTIRSNPKMDKPNVSRMYAAATLADSRVTAGSGSSTVSVPALVVDGTDTVEPRSSKYSRRGSELRADGFPTSPVILGMRGIRAGDDNGGGDSPRATVVAALIAWTWQEAGIKEKGRRVGAVERRMRQLDISRAKARHPCLDEHVKRAADLTVTRLGGRPHERERASEHDPHWRTYSWPKHCNSCIRKRSNP